MNRKEYNLLILKEIEENINSYPDQRFMQILQNIKLLKSPRQEYDNRGNITFVFEDLFYEESEKTYDRMRKLNHNTHEKA